MKTKKRGRPPTQKSGPTGGRLSRTRTFRVRGGMDKYLIWHAKEHGRSVSEEIETRLDRSFYFDGLLRAVAGESGVLIYALSTAASISSTLRIDEKDRSHALQVAAVFIIAALSGVEPMSADWLTKSSFAQQHGLALALTVLESLGAPKVVEQFRNVAEPLMDPTAKILREPTK